MLFVATHDTVRRPGALAIPSAPRGLMRQGLAIAPRRPVRSAVFWRLFFEHSLPRYVVALMPFPVAMFIWPELALPISQAPLLMIGLVLFVENSVLAIGSREKRRALIGEAEAARGLDLMRVRGRAVLTRIAAGRGLAAGRLHLVVEQSAMARVAPLTIVSVQADGTGTGGAGAEVLALDAGERAAVASGLFDAGFDERLLQRINLAENMFLRATTLEAREVSAHARLAAMAAGGAAPALSARG